MKKVIIFSLAVFSAQCINAMEQQRQEKQITLRLKNGEREIMLESELPFFVTIADAADDAPDQEIPLSTISLATMALLRKDVPWALAAHKKKKANITAEEIGSMSAEKRMEIARDAKEQEKRRDYEAAFLSDSVEAGSAADRLGAYELIQKYAQNVADILKIKSSPLFDAIRKNKVDDIKIFDAIRGRFYHQVAACMESPDDWVAVMKQEFPHRGLRSVEVSPNGNMAVAHLCIFGRNESAAWTMKLSDEGNQWISKDVLYSSNLDERVAISADGDTIVTMQHAAKKVEIKKWENESWQESFAIEGIGTLTGVSGDGKTVVVVVGEETKIIKWSDAKKKWIPTYNAYHTQKPISACVSEDNDTVVIAFEKMTQILKWDHQEKEWIESFERDSLQSNPAAVSADGNTVVMTVDNTRKIMQLRDGKWIESHSFNESHGKTAIAGNGNTVVNFSSCGVATIAMRNEQNGEWISKEVKHSFFGGDRMVSDKKYTAAISADGHTVVLAWSSKDDRATGCVKRMQWDANEQNWVLVQQVETTSQELVGLSLNGLTKVKAYSECDHNTLPLSLTIYESMVFDTWEKKVLVAFLKWCKKTGKPVTENAWAKKVVQACDTREQRLLTKEYGNLLRVLTQCTTEKFE